MADRLADILALSDADWQRFSEAAHTQAHGYNWQDASRQFEQVLQNLILEPGVHELGHL
jgi:hypothetical protein